MRKLSDLSDLELGSFVEVNAACSDADPRVFTRGQDHEEMPREDRIKTAAPYCGSCIVRPACLEIGARLFFEQARGNIYGGVFFGKPSYDIVDGKAIPNPQPKRNRKKK